MIPEPHACELLHFSFMERQLSAALAQDRLSLKGDHAILPLFSWCT
jgi:hypothetical protein